MLQHRLSGSWSCLTLKWCGCTGGIPALWIAAPAPPAPSATSRSARALPRGPSGLHPASAQTLMHTGTAASPARDCQEPLRVGVLAGGGGGGDCPTPHDSSLLPHGVDSPPALTGLHILPLPDCKIAGSVWGSPSSLEMMRGSCWGAQWSPGQATSGRRPPLLRRRPCSIDGPEANLAIGVQQFSSRRCHNAVLNGPLGHVHVEARLQSQREGRGWGVPLPKIPRKRSITCASAVLLRDAWTAGPGFDPQMGQEQERTILSAMVSGGIKGNITLAPRQPHPSPPHLSCRTARNLDWRNLVQSRASAGM